MPKLWLPDGQKWGLDALELQRAICPHSLGTRQATEWARPRESVKSGAKRRAIVTCHQQIRTLTTRPPQDPLIALALHSLVHLVGTAPCRAVGRDLSQSALL